MVSFSKSSRFSELFWFSEFFRFSELFRFSHFFRFEFFKIFRILYVQKFQIFRNLHIFRIIQLIRSLLEIFSFALFPFNFTQAQEYFGCGWQFVKPGFTCLLLHLVFSKGQKREDQQQGHKWAAIWEVLKNLLQLSSTLYGKTEHDLSFS